MMFAEKAEFGGRRLTQLPQVGHADEIYDNAHAESLFSRYKAELLEGGAFANVEQARLETFNYIEGYYCTKRIHSSPGYLTPAEFAAQWSKRSL